MDAALPSKRRRKQPWLPPLAVVLLLAWGCAPAESNKPQGQQPGQQPLNQAGEQTATNEESGAARQQPTAAALATSADLEAEFPEVPDARVTWDVHYLQGKRVGFRRAVFAGASNGASQDEGLFAIEAVDRMEVLRFGQPVRLQVKVSSLETKAGEIREFEYEVPLGEGITAAKGSVHEGQLVLTQLAPKASITKRPWQPETRGFLSVEQSLLAEPMQPGDKRMLRALQIPPLDLVGTLKLKAIDFETTKLLAGEFRLLKIEQTLELPGQQEMQSILWTTPEGDILKQAQPAYQMEMYRTTRAVALQPQSTPEFDLGADVIVRIDPPLENPHETKRVVYEVELSGGDPAKVFSMQPSQLVESLDNERARITVEDIGPSRFEKINLRKAEWPTERDQAPSALVQSDDARIKQMTDEALAEHETTSSYEKASLIEKYVRDHMNLNDFTTVFASAAEVAQTHEGDCTEHAVLMTAMCRAAKLPARVAMGLVYHAPSHGFAYHMWNEVWIGDRWLPMDATLGRRGIGAAHLKLGHSSLDGPAAYTSFLPVMQVLGRLKVKIVDVQR